MTERQEPLPQIPGYQVIRLIGRGAMGKVYQALQVRMERMVAIKILSPSCAAKAEYVERFFSEARAVAKFQHPNIIAGIDVGEWNGLFYFVMEYVEGKDLLEIVREKGPLSYSEVLSIALQMACALEEAEKRGIVHRDIKPENILINDEGVAKLCDLGLAKQATLLPGKSQTTMGTPHYMSPEQVQGRTDIDTRSDIYSLGATLYHLLLGEPPFDGESPLEVMQKQLDEPFPSLHRPDVPERFRKILRRMVEKDRELRYPSAQQLRADLEKLKYRSGASDRLSKGKRISVSLPQNRSSSLLLGMAALSGILLLAAAGLVLYATGQKPPVKDKEVPIASKQEEGDAREEVGGDVEEESTSEGGTQDVSPSSGREKEVSVEEEAYRELRQFLIANGEKTELCAKKIQAYLREYPQSPYRQSLEKLLQIYTQSGSSGGEAPSTVTSSGQSAGASQSPSPVVQLPPDELWLREKKEELAQLLQSGQFAQLLQLLAEGKRKYPKSQAIWDTKILYEQKILSTLQQKGVPTQKQALANLQSQLESLSGLGEDNFQSRIQQMLQEVRQQLRRVLWKEREESFWVALGSWQWQTALELLDQFPKAPPIPELDREIQQLRQFCQSLAKSYQWVSQVLETLARRKSTSIYDLRRRSQKWKVVKWESKRQLLELRRVGKKHSQKVALHSILIWFGPWLRQKSPWRKKWDPSREFFLLERVFSLENTKSPHSRSLQLWYDWRRRLWPEILRRRAEEALKVRNPWLGIPSLEQLKKEAVAYFRTHRRQLVELYRNLWRQLYTEEGLAAFLKGTVEKKKYKGEELYRIVYDFSLGKELIQDWRPLARNFPYMRQTGQVSWRKGYMVVQGGARLPIVFETPLQVEVSSRLLPSRWDPANLCVFLSENGRNRPFWFLGLWFRLPGVRRIFLRNIPRRGDVYWLKFPAHGIFLYRPNRANRPLVLHLLDRPRIYHKGKYRVTFFHIGDRMGIQVKGRVIAQVRETLSHDRGRVCLYTGGSALGYSKVVVWGKIPQDWLERYSTSELERRVQKFAGQDS